MDFNTDGGYNNPTISIDGAFATELSYGGAKDVNCRDLLGL